MMRFTLVARSLAALLIASGSLVMNGQTIGDAIKVDVPFAFTVGTQSMAPGTYLFSVDSGPFLLSVVNIKTGAVRMFTVHPERDKTIEDTGHLIFDKFADRHVLNEIHFRGSDEWSELTPLRDRSRMEASSATQPDHAVVMARR